MNYLDLFHGIGGFALGAAMSGMKFQNHLCSDIVPFLIKLYAQRFPDSVQLGDITQINFKKLKKMYPGKWVITGGVPCQDISYAGRGKGLIDEEGNKTRSGLWFDYAKAIRILRPEYAIIENVGALVKRGLATMLKNLAEIGYNAEWQDIRAEDMGLPHKRERIWIVAYPNDKRLPKFKPSSKKQKSRFRFNRISMRKEWCIRDSSQAYICRGVHGIPNRLDRVKGLGNAIIPKIAGLLLERIGELIDNRHI